LGGCGGEFPTVAGCPGALDMEVPAAMRPSGLGHGLWRRKHGGLPDRSDWEREAERAIGRLAGKVPGRVLPR
jgi:hypothetical protein